MSLANRLQRRGLERRRVRSPVHLRRAGGIVIYLVLEIDPPVVLDHVAKPQILINHAGQQALAKKALPWPLNKPTLFLGSLPDYGRPELFESHWK